MALVRLSPLNQRRWRNFKANRRAYWSAVVFGVLFFISLFAEFLANDSPLVVRYRGEIYTPIFNFYPETTFGGDFRTEAVYRDIEVQCLIISGGVQDCWDDPEGVIEAARDGSLAETAPGYMRGWVLWPPLPPPCFFLIIFRPGVCPGGEYNKQLCRLGGCGPPGCSRPLTYYVVCHPEFGFC